MASRNSSRVLTDHDEIRRWAEERDARPSAVQKTHTDDNVGIIRLDFPGYSGENSLEEIEWDEWFDKFDDNNLVLIVQDQIAEGETSNFNKIVSRDSVESSGKSRSRAKKSTSARASTSKKSSARSQSRSTASGKKKKTKSTSHRRAA
jgi:hypothetical protein